MVDDLISSLMPCMWLSLMMVIEVIVLLYCNLHIIVQESKVDVGQKKNQFYIKSHVKIALGYTDYSSSECEVKMKCFSLIYEHEYFLEVVILTLPIMTEKRNMM